MRVAKRWARREQRSRAQSRRRCVWCVLPVITARTEYYKLLHVCRLLLGPSAARPLLHSRTCGAHSDAGAAASVTSAASAAAVEASAAAGARTPALAPGTARSAHAAAPPTATATSAVLCRGPDQTGSAYARPAAEGDASREVYDLLLGEYPGRQRAAFASYAARLLVGRPDGRTTLASHVEQ